MPKAAPPAVQDRPKDIARFVRLPNGFTAAADIMAGAALAGVALHEPRVLIAALGSALLYAAGIALNDLLDLSKDRKLHPERMLPSGRVRYGTAAWVIRVGFGLGFASAFFHPTFPHIAITFGLLMAIVTYDTLPEGRPWLSAAAMASCRALNLMRGITLSATPVLADPLLPASFVIGHFALVALIAHVSSAEDSPQGHRSGRAARAALAVPFFLPFLFALGLGDRSPLELFWLGLAGAAIAWHATHGQRLNVPPALVVRRSVFALILYDATIVAFQGDLYGALAVACLWPLARALARWLQQRGS